MIALYIAIGSAYIAAGLGTISGMRKYDDDNFDLTCRLMLVLPAWPLVLIYKGMRNFVETR